MIFRRYSHLLWFARLTAVCVVVLGGFETTALRSASAEPKNNPAVAPQAIVILIGGMDSDPTPAQINRTEKKNRGNSGLYQLCCELENGRMVCEYFNWNGSRAGDINKQKVPSAEPIKTRIHEHLDEFPDNRIFLVGNSWGGHTAWQVADELSREEQPVSIDRLILLDPNSTGEAAQRQPELLPQNVKQAVHYYTHNIYCWGEWTGERIEAIDLGDPKLGYSKNGVPAYASPFDFRAHVAAEWDNRVHEEIKQIMLKRLPAEKTASK